MSAPETELARERRRHIPALVGISAALCLAGLAAIVLLALDGLPADEQATPVPTEPQVDASPDAPEG